MNNNQRFIVFIVVFFTINFIFESSSYGEQGQVSLNQFAWTLEGDGVRVTASSATVLRAGLMCDRLAKINPTYYCGVGIDIRSRSLSKGIAISYQHADSFTADDAVSALNSAAGRFWSGDSSYQSTITGACLFLFNASSIDEINQQNMGTSYPDGVCSGGVIPPGPVPATCKFSGDVLIDYGNLSAEAAFGATKTGTTTITCDQDTTISLQVYDKSTSSNKVQLRDDKSLSATLTVDGADTSSEGEIINVKANEPSTIMIDSELSTSGTPDAGEFTGSALAVISIP